MSAILPNDMTQNTYGTLVYFHGYQTNSPSGLNFPAIVQKDDDGLSSIVTCLCFFHQYCWQQWESIHPPVDRRREEK